MNAADSDLSVAHGPIPARVLPAYRERLSELLRMAEAVAPAEPADLWRAATALVDDLNADLLTLYRRAEADGNHPGGTASVTATLERLRDILRVRSSRARPMRDTLHRALAGL